MSTELKSTGAKSITVYIDPQKQTLESLNAIVGGIVSRAGCHTCGLIAVLRAELVSNPGDLEQHGARSVRTE